MPATVAGRIEAVRRSIPPPRERRARNAYISKDDFADLLGAGRSTVINWTMGRSFPEERYRLKLAELSRGVYTPDDFRDPDATERGAGGLREQLAELQRRVDELEDLRRRLAGEEDVPPQDRAGYERNRESS